MIMRIRSKQLSQNKQIEEEKIHIDPIESFNRPLTNSPLFKNMKSYQSLNQHQQEQSNQRIRFSQPLKQESKNSIQEDAQIILSKEEDDQEIVNMLNQLAFCIQDYNNEDQNDQRVIYANVHQENNNEGISDEQNSSLYDFGSDDIEENHKNTLSKNIEEFNQKKKKKTCLLNFQQSDLNVNQPRSFYNHDNSKYLKRNQSQNVKNLLSFGAKQKMRNQGNQIGREVFIFKEKTVLQIDRAIQTGIHPNQSENQSLLFQKIMEKLQRLLQNNKLKDFLSIYTNYCELINNVEEAYNSQIVPQEIINQLIQLLNQKANQKIQPRYISSQVDAQISNKIVALESNLEIIEASQSISASSNNNAMSNKESNLQIEALKRLQNNNLLKVPNQNQMRRFKIQNLNHDNLQSSGELQSFVREYDQENPSNENESQQVIIQKRPPNNRNTQQSSQTLRRFTNLNQQSQVDTKDIKLMLCIIDKLKQALKINKTIEFYIQNSISSASIIANLTEDLLTLAKIKNNVFELNLESRVNLLDIVNDAYQVLGFNAASKKIGLLLEFDDQKTHIFQNVTTDKRRILQILLNFLSNSIKFTNEEGYIKISFKILDEIIMQSSFPMDDFDNQINSDQNMNVDEEIIKNIKLEIAIQDTGAGISKDNINKLFTDFAKLNEHKQMNVKGTGLGLSICKQIIEQMGGKVSVVSQVGVGTKFKISINMDAYDRIDQFNNQSSQESIKQSKKLFSEMFENNFGIDLDYQKKHETSLDNIENNQIFQKTIKSSKVYKFDSQKNALSPQDNDKNQNFINKMLIITKKKLKDQEKIETSNSNCSFLNDMSRLEISECKSQFDINDNLMNFNPIKRSSNFMGSLIEQNQNDDDQRSDELNYEQEKKETKNDLIQYWNINQINYLSQENLLQNQNELNIIRAPLEIKDKHIDIIKSGQNNLNQNEKQLIKIDEMKESSSLYVSINVDQKNDSQFSSKNMSLQSSTQKKSNSFENEQLQIYLNKNNALKQVIDISIKYKRHKLQFLAANDDSYSLFFIQTSLSQMKNVSLVDTAENGQVAVNYVKKNVFLDKDEDQIYQNYYDAIFLDLDMPIMNGSEACKQIQQHYYQRKKKCYDYEQIHQNQLIIKLNDNQCIDKSLLEEQMQNLRQNKIIPKWVQDLKAVYDQYIEICEQEEQNQDLEKSNSSNLQIRMNQTKNQVLKVFNILYASQRYRALQIMERPFIFAYSAFTNQKIKDETIKNGFDKLIDAPLNKLKVEEIIEKYIEPYAEQLTKIMLQNIGPIPKFDEMIDKERILNTKKVSSGNMYKSVFHNLDLGPKSLLSRDFNKAFLNDHQREKNNSSEDIQDIESDDESSLGLEEEIFIRKRNQVVKIAGLSLIKEGEEEGKEQNLVFQEVNAVADLNIKRE